MARTYTTVTWRQKELSHESNRRFSPCVRRHRRERHRLSGVGQTARGCLAGGTVHWSQLLAAQPARQTHTGAPRDPSAGLVTCWGVCKPCEYPGGWHDGIFRVRRPCKLKPAPDLRAPTRSPARLDPPPDPPSKVFRPPSPQFRSSKPYPPRTL
jgi:hypothetical protein